MKRLLIIFFAATLLCSCNELDIPGMLYGQGEDVNKRFAHSIEYNKDFPIPDIILDVDEYQLYVVTDIHSRGDCPKLVNFVSDCLADTLAEHYVLCLGDVVTGKDSFEPVSRDIQPLYDAGWSFFSVPGNHDVCFGLWQQYVELWPSSTYTFRVVTGSAGTDFFIMLDSADGKLGTEQRKWLEATLEEAQDEHYRNIYVLTHTHFFKRDLSQGVTGNYSLEETMDLLSLFSRYGVYCVLTGHDHYYEHTIFRGVEYYTLNALANDVSSYYIANFGDKLTLKELTH